jgi:hypothetical protein
MRAYEIAAAVVGMMTLGGSIRGAGAGKQADLVVYVTGVGLLSGTEDRMVRKTVSEIFERVGVQISWVNGKPQIGAVPGAPVVVHVRLVQQSMADHSAGALAYATPYAHGLKAITVLYDRVRMIAGSPDLQRQLLAHVLAHEIGHVLQGTDRHAPTGIMKACWNRVDVVAMGRNSLEFTSTDLELIREGLNRAKTYVGDRPPSTHD